MVSYIVWNLNKPCKGLHFIIYVEYYNNDEVLRTQQDVVKLVRVFGNWSPSRNVDIDTDVSVCKTQGC